MYLVLLLYALFASVFTIGKTGLFYSDPVFFVGFRMFIAGILMVGFQLIYDFKNACIQKKDFIKLFLLAFFAIYLTNVLEFWGLKYLTSAKTCFIYSLSPFFSALLCYLLFSEKMSLRKWIGLIIGFLGFLPLLLHQSGDEWKTGNISFFSLAELAVIGAAASSVYGWILLKQLVTENKLKPMMVNGVAMLIGGGMALFHSYLTEPWTPFPVTEWKPFIECTALLIIVSSIICYNLYGYLLKKYSPTFLSFAGFTTPFFAALFGYLFLNEGVGLPFYFSAVVVFLGLLIFYKGEVKVKEECKENILKA